MSIRILATLPKEFFICPREHSANSLFKSVLVQKAPLETVTINIAQSDYFQWDIPTNSGFLCWEEKFAIKLGPNLAQNGDFCHYVNFNSSDSFDKCFLLLKLFTSQNWAQNGVFGHHINLDSSDIDVTDRWLTDWLFDSLLTANWRTTDWLLTDCFVWIYLLLFNRRVQF